MQELKKIEKIFLPHIDKNKQINTRYILTENGTKLNPWEEDKIKMKCFKQFMKTGSFTVEK